MTTTTALVAAPAHARLAMPVLLLGAVLISLSLVGIDITVLGVFGGALGVGLGFGLQKIASNYVSGFIILIDRSLREPASSPIDPESTTAIQTGDAIPPVP